MAGNMTIVLYNATSDNVELYPTVSETYSIIINGIGHIIHIRLLFFDVT